MNTTRQSGAPIEPALRPAEPGDTAALAAIDENAFESAERWSAQLWAEELEADNRFVEVAVDHQGAILGVISIQIVGPTAELIRIAVTPGAQRHGLGGRLLGTGLQRAVAVQAEEMLLEVRHDNTVAGDLYTRWGFFEIARRSDYYGEGVDAVIMQRELEDPDED